MKSPGKPSLRRDVERLFWREIANGVSSEDAALAVGASSAAGSRWFRERGGMPTFMLVRALGSLSVVRGARRDRAVQGSGRRGSGDLAAVGAFPLDDLQGAAPQRGHPVREARVSRIGRAVEGRVDGTSPKDCEARRQRAAARIRAGATLWRGSPAGRDGGGGTCDGALEGPEQAKAPGPQMGERVEPGADIKPAEDRLPR
jgi:hypothetical protein